jgi:ribosomal protein L12E/L44/L45/RPP1/RPP2
MEQDCSRTIAYVSGAGQTVERTMRSKPGTFEAYAERCTRMAAAVHDTRLKSLMLNLADQWRRLAATTRLLEADTKEIDDFLARQEEEREKEKEKEEERKLPVIYVVNVR